MSDTKKKLIDHLYGLGIEHKLYESDLDEDVHDAASAMASDVNNSGLRGQIEFLVESIGGESTAKLIRERGKKG